jgi:hypothetical protein
MSFDLLVQLKRRHFYLSVHGVVDALLFAQTQLSISKDWVMD